MIAGAVLAVPDRRGGVPAGSIPEGIEPGERAGAGAGPDPGHRPDVPPGPDQGADRRHQLRRLPAVHDPRREVPEPQGRRGGPRPLRGQGRALRRADRAARPRASSRAFTSRRDAIDPWIDEAQAEALRSAVEFLVRPGHDGHSAGAAGRRRSGRRRPSPRRPAATSTPTAGSSTRRRPCRPATDRCPTSTCWPSCSTGRAGRSTSHEVLAELAETVPAFAVARGGKLPQYGVPLGEAKPGRRRRRAAPPFLDSWFVAQGAARGR